MTGRHCINDSFMIKFERLFGSRLRLCHGGAAKGHITGAVVHYTNPYHLNEVFENKDALL